MDNGDFRIGNCTDVGKTRPVNEDNMVTFDSINGRVVAVCDGMGGHNAGEIASATAVAVIRDILENNMFEDPCQAITRAAMAANQAILHKASSSPELNGMGCTCVMAIIRDGKVYYGSVGDSRIYYINNHTIRQITKDQSYVQMLVDSGEITPEQAETHPRKNEITNAIGIEGMVPPNTSPMPITPDPGSYLLLCTDGLSGMVSESAMEHVVSKPELGVKDKAQQLVDLANQAGGLDNITVQIVEFSKDSSSAGKSVNGKGKKRSNTLVYLICLFVLIACGAAAYFLLFNKQKTKIVVEKTEQPIPYEKPKVEEPKPKMHHHTQKVEDKEKVTEKKIPSVQIKLKKESPKKSPKGFNRGTKRNGGTDVLKQDPILNVPHGAKKED